MTRSNDKLLPYDRSEYVIQLWCQKMGGGYWEDWDEEWNCPALTSLLPVVLGSLEVLKSDSKLSHLEFRVIKRTSTIVEELIEERK